MRASTALRSSLSNLRRSSALLSSLYDLVRFKSGLLDGELDEVTLAEVTISSECSEAVRRPGGVTKRGDRSNDAAVFSAVEGMPLVGPVVEEFATRDRYPLSCVNTVSAGVTGSRVPSRYLLELPELVSRDMLSPRTASLIPAPLKMLCIPFLENERSKARGFED
jgi:hypothetical protein